MDISGSNFWCMFVIGDCLCLFQFFGCDFSSMFKEKVFNIYINLVQGLGFIMGYFLVMNLGL